MTDGFRVYQSPSGVTNMFKLNTSDQIQVGAALNIDGGIIFPSDGGYLTAMDMPFTTTGNNAYVFRIGSSNVLSIYGQSDSSGNASNLGVGIGTTAPAFPLQVDGSYNGQYTGIFIHNDYANTGNTADLSFGIRGGGVS